MAHTADIQTPSTSPQAPSADEVFERALRSLDCRDDALALLERAIALEPAHRGAFLLLGMTHLSNAQFPLALQYLQQAAALEEHDDDTPADPRTEAHIARCALQALSVPLPAGAAPVLHAFVGNALCDIACHDLAIAHFEKALRADLPTAARGRVMNGIGRALAESGRFAEAVPYFEQALTVPDEPASVAQRHSNLGMALGQLGHFEEEVRCYERALALKPTAVTRFNYSLAALRFGEYERGWRWYEYRWGKRAPQWRWRRSFAQALWDGGDIAGRRILLHAEQGFGDTIQFVRYAPLVAGRGADVILEVQRELVPLFASLPGLTALVARGDPLPAFDVQCPLLSLPLAFGTTPATVPCRIPYLEADANARSRWRERLGDSGGRFRVGLVWGGSPSHKRNSLRSIPVEKLEDLVRVAGASFHSFQVGARPAELGRLDAAGGVSDLAPHLTDFNETAAAAERMDLLISVDTSVAHLAGALGVETWLLLRSVADWRWQIGRADSPWYPSARLFRQTMANDWTPVVEQVCRALEDRIAARGIVRIHRRDL
jgi:tetratricopeptide (TPR) repeat protein